MVNTSLKRNKWEEDWNERLQIKIREKGISMMEMKVFMHSQ
jgi:hypothetical protein